MGYSLSLLAIQCADPEESISRLGFVRTGRFCEYAREPVSGYGLPENWYLLVIKGSDSRFLKPDILRPLSETFPLVACSIDERVMFSSAEYWKGGSRVWRAEHDSENGPIHLRTTGVLPVEFEAMAQECRGQQREEGGADAGVDYYFDIPLNAAKSIMGFKHDEEISGVDYDRFEVLDEAGAAKGRKPWWRFWK
jgi:hypothetical protein